MVFPHQWYLPLFPFTSRGSTSHREFIQEFTSLCHDTTCFPPSLVSTVGRRKKKEPQTQHKEAERQVWDRGLTSGSYKSKLTCPISLKRTHGLYAQRYREKCNPFLQGQRPDQGQDCQGPVECWCSLNNEGMLTWTSMVTHCYWMRTEKWQEFW